LLTGITQALANLDKTLKLSLSVNGSLWSAISCYSRNYSRNYTECKTPDHFPTNLTNQWCDFFHSSWNLQLYFFS
jgi:hypothetical protein